MRTLATGSNVAEGAVDVSSRLPGPTASRPTISAESARIVPSSGRAELILQGQLPDSPAGRGEDRVGQRGRRDRGPGFADPARRFQVADQMHFDGRGLVDPHHANVVEVGLLDAAVLE